ncbi:MAG: hypothetical protein V1489_00735 [Candidatus Liptonbacteria bacterium]
MNRNPLICHRCKTGIERHKVYWRKGHPFHRGCRAETIQKELNREEKRFLAAKRKCELRSRLGPRTNHVASSQLQGDMLQNARIIIMT